MSVRHFHVSSVRNRDSIRRFGLDWSRMGPARGGIGDLVESPNGYWYLPETIPATRVSLHRADVAEDPFWAD